MRLRFRWIAAAVALGLALLGVVLAVGLPAVVLGEALARQASSHLGVELTRGRFRLRLDEGLVLEDGEAVASTKGRRYRIELPRVVFEPRPRALLSGFVEVRAIRLQRPRIELLETEEAAEDRAVPESEDEEGFFGLRFAVSEVVLEEASVFMGDEDGSWPSALDGVEVRFEEIRLADGASGLLALEGSGSFSAKHARLGELDLADGRADLFLHDGRFSLTLLKFRTGLAPFVAEMRVDLERSPFGYDVSALGEPFDAAPLVAAPPGNLGEASLLIEVFGRGPAPSGFRAQGSLSLPGGELGALPALEAVNASLGRDVFAASDTRREVLVVYRVRDGYVLFEPFELTTAKAVASIRGRAYLDGRLDLEVEAREPERGASSLSVTGTLERPVVKRL